MNVEAHLIGGPGNGTIRAIPDIMREIKIAHVENPLRFLSYQPDDSPFATVPVTHFYYQPVRAVVYYEVSGMDKR